MGNVRARRRLQSFVEIHKHNVRAVQIANPLWTAHFGFTSDFVCSFHCSPLRAAHRSTFCFDKYKVGSCIDIYITKLHAHIISASLFHFTKRNCTTIYISTMARVFYCQQFPPSICYSSDCISISTLASATKTQLAIVIHTLLLFIASKRKFFRVSFPFFLRFREMAGFFRALSLNCSRRVLICLGL